MSILDEINQNKLKEVALAKKRLSVEELKRMPLFGRNVPSLSASLRQRSGIIAEHKRQSPSKGVINAGVQLEQVVRGYQEAGASAVSVLTDQNYFGGSLTDLQEAAALLQIPILRKDFMLDEYQLYEAKAFGAAAILLIAASLTQQQVETLSSLAHELGMEVLFEIHHAGELEKLSQNVDIVGVNNRNLNTFSVDVEQSVKLFDLIPGQFIKISESGISSPETVKRLKHIGYEGFLMGENFMKENDPGAACKNFITMIG
ncbi:indole-3-glycerol phosphate synthase TrpC [Roseimarinus sediminis]|uniref:indole-3-glycerol phosphate synthase TrpC n=1 Tax=Roseimarinus sediminis TaxID=1610899 RepID=UPI003D1DFD42